MLTQYLQGWFKVLEFAIGSLAINTATRSVTNGSLFQID